MEIKVRAVGEVEQKSTQEVEKELLEKHEQEVNSVEETPTVAEETTTDVEPEAQPTTQSSELKEEDVLSYIKNRYEKDFTSVDQMFEHQGSNEELPEDVKAYFEYKQKTGRGMGDYIKLSRDFDAMDDDQLLSEYLLASGEATDAEDVEFMMDDFSYDEDLDDEKDIKKAKLAKKKTIVKAKKFFNEQKEMYKEPLESSTASISEQQREALEAYNQYVEQAKTQEEELKRKRDWFMKKTDEVFNPEFKGFDFKVGEDKTLTFLPTKNVDELKKVNSDSASFIKKFINDSGLLEDASGYHRALAIANNPERFAKFFYEQGMSDATEGVARKMKNINMSERNTPQVARSKDGLQIRSISAPSSRGLTIRSKKNK